MLRVVIADDERIIRRTIRLIGNWEENNMEIVGEAQNGLEAVELIKTKTCLLYTSCTASGPALLCQSRKTGSFGAVSEPFRQYAARLLRKS